MSNTSEIWTREHDLALIYIALGYSDGRSLSEAEQALIADVLEKWRSPFPREVLEEVIMEAVAVFLEDEQGREVLQSIRSLKDQLTMEERREALRDAFRIAEADAIIVHRERNLISILAQEWEIKATETHLLEQTTATLESRPAWSLMHDLCLLYLVVAHSPDNELSDSEIGAMIECLHEWQPDLEESEIRDVLKETLAAYAQEPDAAVLGQAIQTIKTAFPEVQLMAAFNDLVYIAMIEGTLAPEAAALLGILSEAWGLEIEIDGTHPATA